MGLVAIVWITVVDIPGLLELANCYCEMELKARCAALVCLFSS